MRCPASSASASRAAASYDRLPVEVELAAGAEASGALALSVEDAIKATLRASASVTLLPAASMPRTGGKTKRLIRED